MSKKRILLADDHAIVRAGIRKVVEEFADLEVVAEVGNGPALIAGLEQFKPDCILIDVTMPDFDPVNTIRNIRAVHPESWWSAPMTMMCTCRACWEQV